ncbi:MAG: hypothetical protein K2H09_04575 [Treponemataceae bacterium]|nr:hypothetical protein [Treponemataceae bacterium]
MRRSFASILTDGSAAVLAAVFFLPAAIGLSGCASSGIRTSPYRLDGEMVQGGGLRMDSEFFYLFSFANCTEREIAAFSVTLGLCDGDGLPAFEDYRICADFSCAVPPGGRVELAIPLDDSLYDVPDELYQTDCFYVNRIVFADGTVWEDVFGRYGL